MFGMPLTTFQREVARILAKNRNPDSHIAGGAVINRDEASLRFSDDLDIFHDVAAMVAASAEADAEALRAAGLSIDWQHRGEAVIKAIVSREGNQVRLDWTND